MRSIFKELSRVSISKAKKESTSVLKPQSMRGLEIHRTKAHYSTTPSEPLSSTASEIPKEPSSNSSSSQAKQEVKPFSQQAGQNQFNFQENSKRLKDLTDKAFYGVATFLSGWAFKECQDIHQKLDELELSIATQMHERQVVLDDVPAFQVQPRLYLTTLTTDKDHQTQRQEQAFIKQWQLQLQHDELTLAALERRLLAFLSSKAPQSTLNPIKTKIVALQARLMHEKEKQALFEALHTVVWLHKIRQYTRAVEQLQPLIKQIEQWQQTKHPTTVSLPYLLAVVYNTQAKLEACLVRTSVGPHDAWAHSDASLANYHKAISVLEKESGFEVALATLKNSQAYLLSDRGDHTAALALHKAANTLKPEDEHILCGIGQDFFNIEQARLATERDKGNIDMAYGYVTRALQINDQVPNIYVTRGKIQVALGNLVSATQDFDHALKLDKNHSEAQLQKAQLLIRQSQCYSAMHFFKAGLVPLVGKPQAIEQQLAKFKAVKESSSSKCVLPKEEELFSESAKPSNFISNLFSK